MQIAADSAPVRLRLKIGNAAGVRRSTVRSVSAGSVAADLGDPALHLLQRDDHVGRRLELRGNLGGAAERASIARGGCPALP